MANRYIGGSLVSSSMTGVAVITRFVWSAAAGCLSATAMMLMGCQQSAEVTQTSPKVSPPGAKDVGGPATAGNAQIPSNRSAPPERQNSGVAAPPNSNSGADRSASPAAGSAAPRRPAPNSRPARPGDAGPETPDIAKPDSRRGANPPQPSFELTQPSGRSGLNIGDEVLEIDGRDADGIDFRLSDYRGKVVMLDFWGHW